VTDLVGGRYSYGHGRGSFLGNLAVIEWNLRPLSFTPRLGRDRAPAHSVKKGIRFSRPTHDRDLTGGSGLRARRSQCGAAPTT
jgi:hypothetical protein